MEYESQKCKNSLSVYFFYYLITLLLLETFFSPCEKSHKIMAKIFFLSRQHRNWFRHKCQWATKKRNCLSDPKHVWIAYKSIERFVEAWKVKKARQHCFALRAQTLKPQLDSWDLISQGESWRKQKNNNNKNVCSVKSSARCTKFSAWESYVIWINKTTD